MKTLKATILLCLTILSQLAFATEWSHQQVEKNGHYLKLSYTKRWVTPTIGTNGGVMTGQLYVDLYSLKPAIADKIEVFEVYSNTSASKLVDKNFTEASSTHAWAQLDTGNFYSGILTIGRLYRVKVHVDGSVLEFNLKLI